MKRIVLNFDKQTRKYEHLKVENDNKDFLIQVNCQCVWHSFRAAQSTPIMLSMYWLHFCW